MSAANRASAVIVDFHAGDVLVGCLDSLANNGVSDVVVVNNGPRGASDASIVGREVTLVEPEANLGYGRGVNRGVAAVARRELLIVSNPDVVVHPGAVDALIEFMDEHPAVGIAGPTILNVDGSTYPSARLFPNPFLAMMHALLAPLWPANPWTAKYRAPARDGHVDWVSGAFFITRFELFERLGGFDERYFMFAEEMDLCWRVGRAGYSVATCPAAVITHIEGVSREKAPRAMIIAHHRSAMRFEVQTARGWRRLLVPLAMVVLTVRLGVVFALAYLRGRGGFTEDVG